jgi:hypothetical protein
MGEGRKDKVQKMLTEAIEEGAPHAFEEPIPVLVTLDNGVKYKGDAIEVQAKSDIFPDGLVMVRTANSDIGVPVRYIKGR